MSRPRLALLQGQHELLTRYLDSHPQGHERAAAVLFRRIADGVEGFASGSDRYIATEVVPFKDEWVAESSTSHVRFEMRYLRDLFRRCDEDALVFGFVHNHPGGYSRFSEMDDENEFTLLRALANRNGSRVHLVSLLWTDGHWLGRVRSALEPQRVENIRHAFVLSSPLGVYGYETQFENSLQARQAAAFGKPFVDKLGSLRVGIVGAGGTGSPTVTLLARAGVKEIVLIDNDILELSNLNRVRGARVSDVGGNKVDVLRDYISSLGLGATVAAYNSLADRDPTAIDALATCDVVFGCTDDQIAREVLNAALYIYLFAYIDMGLGGQVVVDPDGDATLRYHYGRVSTILPEQGECLFCQGVISDELIRREYALRENPNMSEVEAVERYLVGGGEQAPGVGPFTSAVADYAVATLFDLIRPFRKYPPELRPEAYKIDFVKMELRSSAPRDDLNCPYCGTRDYLLHWTKYRLNRPTLGKVDEAT